MEETKIGVPNVHEVNSVPDVSSSSFQYASSEAKKKESMTDKMRENPWILATIVLGVVTLVLLFGNFNLTGNAVKGVSGDQAASELLNYLNSVADSEVTLVSVEEESGLYTINVEYKNQTLPIYVTKDGTKYTPSLISISDDSVGSDSSDSSTSSGSSVKSDKPLVELFVMSFCPYGTQAEKGILPAVSLLGDSIDFKIRYVYYAMHGEKEINENLREYCIQKTQEDKFLDYMTCFLTGDGVESNGYITNGNDPESCMQEAGIDSGLVSSCVDATDEMYSITEMFNDKSTWLSGSYPLFPVEDDLNEEYSIGGSPTLVINGVQVSSARDSASYLDAICASFSDGSVPEECSVSLSSASPSPYFGWDSTGTNTAASCS